MPSVQLSSIVPACLRRDSPVFIKIRFRIDRRLASADEFAFMILMGYTPRSPPSVDGMSRFRSQTPFSRFRALHPYSGIVKENSILLDGCVGLSYTYHWPGLPACNNLYKSTIDLYPMPPTHVFFHADIDITKITTAVDIGTLQMQSTHTLEFLWCSRDTIYDYGRASSTWNKTQCIWANRLADCKRQNNKTPCSMLSPCRIWL